MKKEKTSFEKKLLNYSLTAGVVLSMQTVAVASISVTSSGHGLPKLLNSIGGTYVINFENGTNTASNNISFQIDSANSKWIRVQGVNGTLATQGSFIGTAPSANAWYPKPVTSVPITPSGGNTWGHGKIHNLREGTLAWNGTAGAFLNQGDKYLGVKFKISGSTHYGWVLINVTSTSITIKSYAYETTANTGLSSPLPVELKSFSALTELNGSIKLNWQTATEVNNHGFEVERATLQNGIKGSFEKIGFVQGHGNSNSPNYYTFVDNSPAADNLTYRLKQINNDGSYKYSKEVTVVLDSPLEFKLGQNYPNPFNPSTNISFTLPESGNVVLKVYNSIGQEVATLINNHLEAGFHSIDFNADNLASGVYVYRLEANGKYSAEKKMNLLK